MTPYDAVLTAADYIEKNPEDFDFPTYESPDRCGAPGCALGWIGFFGHLGRDASEVGYALCEEGESQFYERMKQLTHQEEKKTLVSWRADPALCVKGMRAYAEEHLGYCKKPVWALMRDREAYREALTRLDAQPAYDRFRQELVLEHVPESAPGNSVPSNEPAEEDEVL